MNILVTGAKGFVGLNLVARLKALNHAVFEYDKSNTLDDLQSFVNNADFIFHLAGVNRPQNNAEFSGNFSFTDQVISCIKNSGKKIPILITSSIQAALDNEYGKSKLEAENILISFEKEYKNPVFILRCPNLFGKWCRPNYNSVIATFCYNVAHNLPITVNKEAGKISFLYIDDLIDTMLSYLDRKDITDERYENFPFVYKYSPLDVSELLLKFKASRSDFYLPYQSGFEAKLYATYLSYLDENDFAYDLVSHSDDRGSFTEIFRTNGYGQTSINIIKPGITKGNHYHHTKNEKFLVVSGTCIINFRNIFSDKVVSYKVSGDKLTVVDIPTGYTHNIVNIGENDAAVIMWANEPFDPSKPDTYFEVV